VTRQRLIPLFLTGQLAVLAVLSGILGLVTGFTKGSLIGSQLSPDPGNSGRTILSSCRQAGRRYCGRRRFRIFEDGRISWFGNYLSAERHALPRNVLECNLDLWAQESASCLLRESVRPRTIGWIVRHRTNRECGILTFRATMHRLRAFRRPSTVARRIDLQDYLLAGRTLRRPAGPGHFDRQT
jgi:hypothetical protein